MPNKENGKLILTFNSKVREQLNYLKPLTTATSFAELMRRGLDLLQKEVENSNHQIMITEEHKKNDQ